MSKAGTVNSRRLLRIFRRDGQRCFWCDHPVRTHRQMRRMADTTRIRIATVDHVKSRDEGGSNELYNLVAACSVCNVERSRPGNAIDAGIVAGKYELPARPTPLPTPRRATKPRPPRKSTVPILDQTPYIERIAWRNPPDVPPVSGLYLVMQPDQGRVLLIPVIVEANGPYVSQGGQRRAWRTEWRWCPLETLLKP